MANEETEQQMDKSLSITAQYDLILKDYVAGDYGEAQLDSDDDTILVKRRMREAAKRRGLTLDFRPSKGRVLRFHVVSKENDEDLQDEETHNREILRIYLARKRELEKRAAILGSGVTPDIINELRNLSDVITELGLRIKLTDDIYQDQSITNIQHKIEERFDDIVTQNGDDIDNSVSIQAISTSSEVMLIKRDINELNKKIIEFSDVRSHENTNSIEFVPHWSVLRPRVQYVDANLVYIYADKSQDMNIMLAFTTLFLGATLSFVASLTATPYGTNTFGLLLTLTLFSLLITLLFTVLTVRSSMHVRKARKQLFSPSISEVSAAATPPLTHSDDMSNPK